MQTQLRKDESVARVREFGLLTRIQATLGILSVFCMLLSTPHTLSSQEIIPDLQTQEYDRQFMNQFYGQVYFQNNLTTWTNHVENYIGTARAAWEASVDTAINAYVDSITTSDSFNTVEAYKDYVSKEMQSQKSQALLNWQDEANRHFLENQTDFVTKLNTNYVDSSYLSRIGQQSLYDQYLNNLSVTQNLQNQVAIAASNWQNTYNQNYQQGLNDFAASITNITEQYESIKNSIAQNQSIFQQNLDAINQYKTTVVTAIKGMLDGFQSDLDAGVTCNLDGGCTYHQKGGALNTAGVLLKDFLDQMRPKVESAALDPSLFFTEISSSFSTFLQAQRDLANNKYVFHESNILTYQSSTGINYETYRNYTQADINALASSIIYQQFGGGAAVFSYNDQWNYEGHGGGEDYNADAHFSTFNNISNPSLRALYSNIYYGIIYQGGNFDGVRGTLQGMLGSNYEVTRVIEANIYSDWANAANKYDPLAWISVLKSQGNLRTEGNRFAFWVVDRAHPLDYWYHYYQMGALQMGLLYEVKDKNQEILANYWDGTSNTLGSQFSLFANQISPAITNWEAQVKSYNEFYTAWRSEADQLEADADSQYEQSLVNLEKQKTAWIAEMEKERVNGISEWTNLYHQAGQMQSQSDYVNFVNSANATVSGMATGNIATNTNSIVSKFDSAIDQLSQRKFDVEPPAPTNFTSTPIEEGRYYAGGSPGFSGGSSPIKTIQETFLKGTTNYIENKIGATFGVGSISPVSGSSGTYSILGAASEKKVDTTLSVNGKDVFNHFQETTNGVYQYSQILSANENNENIQRIEQQKLINQYAYVVNWDNRAEGSLSSTNQYYLDQMNSFQCNRGCTDYQSAFDARFQAEIAQLKNQGFEYLNGKIVKSLTLEEKILVGQADYKTLNDDQKKDFGKCFANPTQGSCGQLLVKEFDYSINEVSNVATLTKRISDGTIAGRDANGYYSGKKDEVRHISLSNLEMVGTPTNKGLFDVWNEADWQSFADASSSALNNYFGNLSKDGAAIGNATTSIRKTEAANEKTFQERKANQEKNDSLIQELALAYFTGGAAGIQATIKGKIEDQINTELAKAWISATGGSEEDIQLASQLMQFMRGRMEMRNMKADNNYLSFKNPLDFINPVKFYGQVINVGVEQLGKAVSGGLNVLNSWTGGTSNMLLGLVNSVVGVQHNLIFGSDNYSDFVENVTAKEKKFAQLKAQEESLVRNVASQGIASATGLPPDLVSTWVNDKVGERKAEKANKFAGNAIMDTVTQVVGVVGGLVKTVLVATGIKEREIQKTLEQGNDLANIGNLEPSSAHMASLGLNEQLFGMKATGTSYQTSVIDINNKEAVKEELGKLAIANHIAATMGIDPSIAKGFVDKGYADHQRRINDRKAQNAAIEQVAITAAAIAVTMGAGAALAGAGSGAAATGGAVSGAAATGTGAAAVATTAGTAGTAAVAGTTAATATVATTTTTSFLSSVGSVLQSIGTAAGFTGTTAIHAGQAITNAVIQGAAGAKNGMEGVIAGVANGILGGVTQAMGPIQSGLLKGITPGLGVTYSPENGWGGMIGLGNTTTNASVSFSQRGNTTVQGSANLTENLQLTTNITTNGEATVGLNYNAGQGPREGWNLGINYDLAGSGLSASLGYTDPGSTIGLTSTFNQDGMSTSAELTGVSIATNGPDGFQLDDINFAEQNINAAQDRTQDDQNKAKLIASGQYSADEVANMSGQEIDNALGELPKDTPNALETFLTDVEDYIDKKINTGIDYAIAIGGSIAGGAALLYGIGANPGSSNNNPPNTQNVVATEPNRKKEDEEGDVADNQDLDRTSDNLDSDLDNSNDTSEFASVIDPMNPNSTDQVGVGGVDIPAHEFTSDGETSPGQDIVPSSDEFQRDVDAGAANRGLIYDPSTDTYIPISGIGRSYTADELANLHQADVQAGRQYKTGDGVQRGIFSSIGSFFGNDSTNSSGDSNAQKSDTNHREKNKFGEVVFTKDQVDTFNKKDKISIYGSDFVKQNINGTDYFVREKNGELQALILREDGRIMETSFQINRSIFGTSYSNAKIKLFDAVGKEITSSNSGHYNPNISAADALANFDKIEAIKNSLLDNFSKDSRLTSEKKLLELRLLGADTTDLESVLTKKRGKDVPLSGSALVEFEEYKRIREKKPLWDEPTGGYKTSTDALASVKLTMLKTESNAEYFQRLGNEIREASKAVDLSDQKKLNEHLASVAKMLGSNLDGKITYAQELDVNGKLEVSGANTVDSNGFRAVPGTDCIRFIGAVLNAAGYTANSSFANLNTDAYLTSNDVEQRTTDIKDKEAHSDSGVEYLRQASNILERTTILYEKNTDIPTRKDFKVPDLEVGQIGITRKLDGTAMKSDHVYVITNKRFNEETQSFEYEIAESYGGHGVANRWITKDGKTDYLYRSEFYKIKPLDKHE